MNLKEESSSKCFGGFQKVFSHKSSEVNCCMKFGIYTPKVEEKEKLPVIIWLSGLTCTEQNFITKSGFQKYAAQHKIIVVNPDTSPRGCNIDGEDESYDFGSGAGFYLDASEEKWRKNYRMFSYVTKELLQVIASNFIHADIDRISIMGHSMGGHGALICALKNPGLFKTASAFAPICNPIKCPWGVKAFTGYLGKDEETWKAYDASELLIAYSGPSISVKIDQGAADNFYKEGQLLPESLANTQNCQIDLKVHDGYDHSYYFISSFMEEHFDHHAKFLKSS